jgi:hypothetical protein
MSRENGYAADSGKAWALTACKYLQGSTVGRSTPLAFFLLLTSFVLSPEVSLWNAPRVCPLLPRGSSLWAGSSLNHTGDAVLNNASTAEAGGDLHFRFLWAPVLLGF